MIVNLIENFFLKRRDTLIWTLPAGQKHPLRPLSPERSREHIKKSPTPYGIGLFCFKERRRPTLPRALTQ